LGPKLAKIEKSLSMRLGACSRKESMMRPTLGDYPALSPAGKSGDPRWTYWTELYGSPNKVLDQSATPI
jgi:hypothetical protein